MRKFLNLDIFNTSIYINLDFKLSAPSNPPPSISDVSYAHSDGGLVNISGSDFDPAITVTTDGVSRSVTYVDSTLIRINVPSHAAGTVTLVVTNPDSQNASSNVTYINPANYVLRNYIQIQNLNLTNNSVSQTASAGFSGSRTASTNGNYSPASTQTVNGWTLPRVNDAANGYWLRLNASTESIVNNTIHEWMWTIVIYPTQVKANAIPPAGSAPSPAPWQYLNRAILNDTSVNYGAHYGMDGSVVKVWGYIFVPGTSNFYTPGAIINMNAANVIQYGIRLVGGTYYIAIRSSANPTWQMTALSGSAMGALSTHHIGYSPSGAAGDRFGGAFGDIYSTNGAFASQDELFEIVKSKFGII